MPCAAPIAFMMSRRLTLLKCRFSGFARRRVEDRFSRRQPRALAQRLDRRLGPRRLDPLANDAIELGDLEDASRLLGSYSLAALYSPRRRLELILLLVLVRLFEVHPRRCLHRPLQRNLVGGVVGRGLRRPAVLGHRLVEVAGPHRGVAVAERRARGAAAHQQRPAPPPQSAICNLKSAMS